MKKIKLLTFVLLLILMSLFMSGCYDYREPNDIAYVVALGIDEGKSDEEYNISIQFARPAQISGGSGEEGGNGEDTLGLVSVESPSIYSAVNLANHVISKTFTLSHTKIIVVSDKLAKKGLAPLIDTIGRSSDIRPNVFLCVSDGEAKKYLESVKPIIEINPVKYYQLIFESDYTSYNTKNNSHSMYLNYKSNTRQNVLPLVGVAKGSEKNSQSGSDQSSSQGGDSQSGSSSSGGEEDKDSQKSEKSQGGGDDKSQSNEENKTKIAVNDSGFEYKMKEYTAGNLDIEKQNDSESIGGAVFKEDKMIGMLSGIENELYNLLNGSFKSNYSVIYSKESPKNPITVKIEQQKKPAVKVLVKGDKPTVDIKLFLEGDFMSLPTDYFVEDDIISFEKETSAYIEEALYSFLNKTAKEFDSDILGFCSISKINFPDYDAFLDYNWNEKYKNTQFSVSVNLKIRRTGLIIRTENVKKDVN